MKATILGLMALLVLVSPLAALAAAQEDEIVIERELAVEVTTGSTDRFGGGDWIRIDVGSTTFAVLYGNESNPNNPKMIAEYDRYLGAAEVYNEEGELIHGLTPLPVRTVLVQSFDFMLEFKDADSDNLVHIPRELQPSDILTGSVDLPRKILSLRQAWSLEDLIVTEGDRMTEVDFNITARDLDYTLPFDEPGVLDEVTFSYHVDVKLEDTTLAVPVYNFTVSQDRGVVAFEKRTETVSGVTVNGTFKYDHYIEGWDWADEASRLALVTHVFAGNFVQAPVARILHLEFALRGLENDREHRDGTVGDRPLLLEGDTMRFEDEWARIGRLTWVSDVMVDGEEMRMLFQLFRVERVEMGGLRAGGLFRGLIFGGAFLYPQGDVIFHDPALDAGTFVPQGQIVVPGGGLLGLAPYFIQLGVVTLAIVGLVAFRALRRKPQA